MGKKSDFYPQGISYLFLIENWKRSQLKTKQKKQQLSNANSHCANAIGYFGYSLPDDKLSPSLETVIALVEDHGGALGLLLARPWVVLPECGVVSRYS